MAAEQQVPEDGAEEEQVPDDGAEEEQTHEDDAEARPRIRVKGADGQWRELKVEPKRTGDPDLDRLWRMSLDEVEQIAVDESHPLHEKARQVQREAVEPIVEAIADTTKSITESFAKSLDASGIMERLVPKIDVEAMYPKLDTSSWLADLLPKIGVPQSLTTPAHQVVPLPEVLPYTTLPEIDFDTVEPPNASLAEIEQASEARAHEIRVRQVELLAELVQQAREDSITGAEALTVAKQSKRVGWIAAWAAIAAALTAAAGIIVTVLLSR